MSNVIEIALLLYDFCSARSVYPFRIDFTPSHAANSNVHTILTLTYVCDF